MISYAKKEMIPQLKRIWNIAFADAYDYINLFFGCLFKEENALVYLTEDEPVSMLMLIDAKLLLEGEEFPIKYIYAVSTLPEHRKKGYSTALIDFANEKYGMTFLTPAEGELFSFYEKQGYKEAFYIKETEVYRNDNIRQVEFITKEISAEKYKKIRDKRLSTNGFIKWDRDYLEYALEENRFLGGKALAVSRGEKEDILLYRIFENELVVKETSLEGDLLDCAINKLLEENNLSICKLRLHFDNSKDCLCRKFALIKGIDKEIRGYANIVLD